MPRWVRKRTVLIALWGVAFRFNRGLPAELERGWDGDVRDSDKRAGTYIEMASEAGYGRFEGYRMPMGPARGRSESCTSNPVAGRAMREGGGAAGARVHGEPWQGGGGYRAQSI